mmetsp:Transcript_11683/g.19016  ORF Transcript_11683/g.19016 Transcript_11683/m.19016 type:complete len:319 (+) Transcript_11683:119-1075(+)|eukprot:CAMPEP_0203774740 /NCGR_PEP_ID=MMETSP0099_2-20121227/5558_1 /ASSEMBLY_ACC=CAM_ASM_000209 /TAXON_ID=96639 /ORGANISM=" , Strain NY0313808BC1" /LENGTH=318 /DNA_ID=CAMNT_0050673069 /DNA_START=101 /DNA_END=1057 /DNA_ORIENTATION=-
MVDPATPSKTELKQHEKALKSGDYTASPFHKGTADILADLGIEENEKKVSEQEITDGLRCIIETEFDDSEDISLKRIRIALESKLGTSLSAHSGYIKSEALRLIEEISEAKKAPEAEPVSKQEPKAVHSENEENKSCPGKVSPKRPATTSKTTPGDETPRLPANQIPFIFPKTLGNRSNVPILAELVKDTGGDCRPINLLGDSGSIGRVALLGPDGKAYGSSPRKKKKKVDTNSGQAQGSYLRLELKGDVYRGIMADSSVSMCTVTIGKDGAKVQGVFNNFLRATYEGNVMHGMRGDLYEGDVDVDGFRFDDNNVNEK